MLDNEKEKDSLVQKPVIQEKPFKHDWLDSSFQELLLPGAPWHIVHRELSKVLAEGLTKQISNPQRAAVLANILGTPFITEYFPDVTVEFTLLDSLSAEEKTKLTMEASGWLKKQVSDAANKLKYVRGRDATADPPAAEMEAYEQHIFHVFSNGMNRELYKLEREIIKAGKTELKEKQNKFLSRATGNLMAKSTILPRDLLTPDDRQSGRKSALSVTSIKTEKVRESLFNLDKVPVMPNMTSKPIDFLAESIVKILEKSPKQFPVVAKRLHGRVLPAKLRRFIWTEVLYKSERETLAYGSNVERILRERFGKTVARNVGELHISRATQSPVSRLIENSVVETYQRAPALYASRSKETMEEACKALNILYTFDKTFEPYLIYWLFPLQLAYSDTEQSVGPEHVYELAMHLDLLNSRLYPTWTQVFAVANCVMDLLKKHDLELYNHLEHIARQRVYMRAEDFIVDLMTKEKEDARRMLEKASALTDTVTTSTDPLSSKGAVPMDTQAMLSDPRLYVRKWIGEGFVSVCDTPAVMFIWDQLFLFEWSSTVFQDFSLVLLLLLRERFLLADDHMSMREVFLNEACKLLLADIQKAWLMLHDKDEDYIKISRCNRFRPAEHLHIEERPNITALSLVDETQPTNQPDEEDDVSIPEAEGATPAVSSQGLNQERTTPVQQVTP